MVCEMWMSPMKFKLILLLLSLFILTGCVSIPKETVQLSRTMGKDLLILNQLHRQSLSLLFNRIKEDVNSFVDEVYAPFVIHYVLEMEMEAYGKGETSLYRSIELAGKEGGRENTDAAISVMEEFLVSAREQIEEKRSELLIPILTQEAATIAEVEKSYRSVGHANAAITNYLQSIGRVKDAQQEALSMVGLEGLDGTVTNTLVELSKKISAAVEKGKEIDIKGDEALLKLESVFSEIKKVTN